MDCIRKNITRTYAVLSIQVERGCKVPKKERGTYENRTGSTTLDRNSPQNLGTTENVIYHLVEKLVDLGHEVTLFAPADARTSAKQISFIPKSLITEGVPWQANLKAYYHLHKSLEYIAEHDFDIVHTHLASSSDMYIFPLAAMMSMPHVTTLHEYFPFDRTVDNWTGDADRYFMEWAQHVPLVATSECAREQVARLSKEARFAGIIHHGIQLKQYPITPQSGGDYFIWIGRFTYEAGAHLAIEAARRAHQPLILAGTKETYNRDAMDYYRHLVEPYIDGHDIRYLGPATNQNKLELLSQARALLNPIQWEEPFGVAMIEAMALGCPVISFQRGAAAEIISHGHTGFLAHDTSDITHYMSRIHELDRHAVREHVERYFSAQVMTEKYLTVYANVIAAHTYGTLSTSPVATQPWLGSLHTICSPRSNGASWVYIFLPRRTLPLRGFPFYFKLTGYASQFLFPIHSGARYRYASVRW
ncbi:glycosyltransferase family 4 protein [Dictyobacter kobayashii]|uniref:Glycosyl transferase n=1 Tax=Dictyobacter kobayashii TaxID=2014872 RepID=A0A402AFR2_9CHLR|nr:glycosyltransferase family 4 protein [Dictyobacter kobayashii]GCE17922.1 glycosyl transferase [Dictyobacter kobayashii]